jgi:hypothetical protein
MPWPGDAVSTDQVQPAPLAPRNATAPIRRKRDAALPADYRILHQMNQSAATTASTVLAAGNTLRICAACSNTTAYSPRATTTSASAPSSSISNTRTLHCLSGDRRPTEPIRTTPHIPRPRFVHPASCAPSGPHAHPNMF